MSLFETQTNKLPLLHLMKDGSQEWLNSARVEYIPAPRETFVQAGPNFSRLGDSYSEMSWQLYGQTLIKRKMTDAMKRSSSVIEKSPF